MFLIDFYFYFLPNIYPPVHQRKRGNGSVRSGAAVGVGAATGISAVKRIKKESGEWK